MKKNDFIIDLHAIEKCRAITSPILSVGILTYNQVDYISQAIESVLIQEVDFDYEIVIADDCSTDGTSEIVRSYAEKYPNLIRAIIHEKNIGIEENANCLKRECKGRYRAVQEGDDYWVDPFRLQKQVEFLENNQDYVAVCGVLSTINQKGVPCSMPWGGLKNNYVVGGEYRKEHFENGKFPCHVGTWVSYNFFHVLNKETYDRYTSYNKLPGDRKSPLFSLHYGKIMILPQVFMMRRLLPNSKSSHISTFNKGSTPLRIFKWALESEKMDREFFKMDLNMLPIMDRMFLSVFREMLNRPSRVNFAACIKVCFISKNKMHHFVLFWSHFGTRIKKKIKSDGLIRSIFKGIKKTFKAIGKIIRGN